LSDDSARANSYLKRALELRAMARDLKDRDARTMIQQIARDYILLARAIQNSAETKPEPDYREPPDVPTPPPVSTRRPD
jgi:hypothetical protein